MDAPKLHVGDVVVVTIRSKKPKNPGEIFSTEWRTIVTTVRKAILRDMFWEYNYGNPDAFYYRDVSYIQKKGKWKRAN